MSAPRNVEFEDVENAVENMSQTSQLNDSPESVAAKESAIDSSIKSAATFVNHQSVQDADAPQQLSNGCRQALRDLKAAIVRVRSGQDDGGDEALQKAADAAIKALRGGLMTISS